MPFAGISQGLGLGGGTLATATGSAAAVTPFINVYSVSFDGCEDYMDCGDDDDFSFGDGAGNDSPFSVSAWIKMTDATDFIVASKDAGVSSNREYTIRFISDKMHFYLIDPSPGTNYIGRLYNTAVTPEEGSWIHVAFTYDGSKSETGIKIYLNSVKVDDTSYSGGSYDGMTNTSQQFYIGRQHTLYSLGKFDEVALFDSELTLTQIQAIYNAPPKVPTALGVDGLNLSPLGWWRMGDGADRTGTTVPDLGSGGNPGELEAIGSPFGFVEDVPS